DYMDSISQEDVISGWKVIHKEEGAWLQKLHVGCTWRTLQWDYPNCEEFIPAIWTIFNYEDQPTDEFYITLMMDWDIDYQHYRNNAVQYYPEYLATRMYNRNSDRSGGIMFLNHLPYTMKATSWNDPIWDTWQDTTKWLWDNILSTQEFSTRTEPDDYRVFHVVGPFSLDPGEEIDIVWAFVYGSTEEDWLENVQTLWSLYIGPGPIPDYPPDPPFIKLSSKNNQVKIKWTRNRIELPFYEYEQSSESTVDPLICIRDWDGYRIYRNLTGTGKIEDGDWHFIAELNSTYVYDKWGTIPNEELDPRYWTTTYWAEFTDKGPGLYNGFKYFYSVVAYDFHRDHSNPEKNAKSIIVKGKTETTPDKIIVSPNPYKPNHHPNFGENIIFSKLPPVCTIKIFTSNGTLIKTIMHTDGTGTENWNLKNDGDNKIASGIYFFVVSSEHGTKKGKIAIIK
ncbi:T9SS type A sorting domain-containing protein, partial [Candidatus Dependentiae bacterium]|nr:T9SS type A sorting domain-containing protein [Candidatus Dependentiae bacterium]